MTDHAFDLTRRKALAALGTIGVASAGAGLGTSAYFSDDETFEDNTLTAGTLDLKAGWEEHYYDGSAGDTADLAGDVQRTDPSGGPAPAGRVGLPSDVASVLSVADDADAQQLLDNTQQDVYPEGYDASDFATGTAVDCAETVLTGDPSEEAVPVIDLGDVKPGDFGEVTFSFALCDNPGYVWAQAVLEGASENGTPEPEAADPDEQDGVVELLDAVQVAVWLDDGDNYQDGGEQPLVAGSLRDVLSGDSPMVDATGLRLDGRFVPIADASPDDFTATGVNRFDTAGDGNYDVDVELATDPVGSGKVAHATSGGVQTNDYATTAVSLASEPTLGDLTDDPTNPTTTLTYDYYGGPENGISAPDEVYLRIEESDGTEHVVYRASNDGAPADEQWKTRNVHREVAGNPDHNAGYNWFEITGSGTTNLGGGGPTSDLSTVYGDDAVVTAMAAGRGTLGGGDVADVYYRNPMVGGQSAGAFPTACFRGATAYNGVLAWWLPVDHANEIQTDGATFSLGLYGEQCRHNDGSGMAPETTTDDSANSTT
ncbi:MAG: SipW-dependent-type signal peptide-containing protein [Haloplanus sp.]